MDNDIIYQPHYIRDKVLAGMAVVIGFFCLIVIAVNVQLEAYVLALIEVFLLLTCIFVYREYKKNRLGGWNLFILPYFFLLVIVYGTYFKGLSAGLFLWSYIIPTLFYLLYGRNHGFIISAIVAIVQTASVLNKEDIALYNTTVISINFILAYVSIWVISHIYQSNKDKTQKKLQELALRDPLTGAYNRLALKHFFSKELPVDSKHTMVVIDLDFFKEVNDAYGHDAGDMVLQEFIKLLRLFLDDKQIYRLGGEEFAVLIPHDRDVAFKLVSSIKEHLKRESVQYEGHSIVFTFSAGIAECREKGSLSDVLKSADCLLYQAKNSGRNQILMVAA